MRVLGMIGMVLCLGACDLSGNAGWIRFNSEGQGVDIEVRPDGAGDDEISVPLTSTTGAVEVGSVWVSPATGPVGTEHTVIVEVLDEFEEQVSRVTLLTSGDRGSQQHLLIQDSADHGLWQVAVKSYGDDGETRTDRFDVSLWRPTEEGEEPDTAAEVEE